MWYPQMQFQNAEKKESFVLSVCSENQEKHDKRHRQKQQHNGSLPFGNFN